MELIKYLPPYLREYKEPEEIMKAEEPEFSFIREKSSGCINNFFVDTADEEGIKRYEDMLGILSSGDESLDYRRFRLKAKLIVSKINITNILNSIMPKGGWTVKCDCDQCKLEVLLNLKNKNYIDEVYEALDRAVPANLQIECLIFHTTHRALLKYRHSQLKNYRHSEIRDLV